MKKLQSTSRIKSHGRSYSQTKAFAYISKVSDEKKVQTKAILEEVRILKNKNLYLDYGAGAGDISFNISKKFKESIFIEPGEKMFPYLKKKKTEKKSNVNLFHMKGEKFFRKHGKKYIGKIDLITLNHVTYFFQDLEKEIKSLGQYLSQNGKIIIIIGYSKNPRKNLAHQFRVKYCGSKPVNPKENMIFEKLFKKGKFKIIKTEAKLTSIDYLLSHPKKAWVSTTNFYLKFLIKRWVDEFSPEEMKFLRKYLDENPFINGKHIIQGENKIIVLNKEDVK